MMIPYLPKKLDFHQIYDIYEINIEMQMINFRYWTDRVLYYACKMLTGQIKKGDDYGIFKKCISISVLDFILFDNEKYKSYYSSYHMTEDRDQRKFNDLLEFHIIELPKMDDITKMEKQISKHIKAKQPVLIYNATYIDNHRYMSYIEGEGDKYQQVGYAHFLINNQGKYELLDIIKPDKVIEKARDITIFEFFKLNSEDYNILANSDIFIISNNLDLAAIERVMNDGETQQKEVDKNPSISFFNEGNENVIEYNFYNQDGVLIK